MTIYTKLDKNGNLVIDRSRGENGKAFSKIVRIYTLEEDPLSWATEVMKNTDSKSEKFVRKFLGDNGLSFDNMAKVRLWFPYYYAAFLMNFCHVLSETSIDEIREALESWAEKVFAKNAKMKAQIDVIASSLPDFTETSKIGEISDAINSLTAFQFLMISMEKI